MDCQTGADCAIIFLMKTYLIAPPGTIKRTVLVGVTMLMAALLLMVSGATAQPASTAPPNFSDELVTSVTSPTALAFTPDGRLLITRQSGELYVYQNGTLVGSPALDLSSVVCGNFERGLLGVAVDPAFTTTQHIFVYYTFRKFGVCSGDTGTTDPVNRVARFTLPISNVIDVNSQVVLLDNIPSPHGNHNAGDLHFGTDGLLYISAGDGGCKLGSGGTLCADQNDNARSLSLLSGKILRIGKDGSVPASNPFFSATGAHRCGTNPPESGSGPCQETFAWGLRNPFRFAFRPGTNDFYINDVGQDVWEEIDAGQAGADYGWNVREGHCRTSTMNDCGAPPAGMTNPIYDYAHNTGCFAITGGAFVPVGIWPSSYDGAYLFGDYGCGKVFQLVPGAGGNYSATPFITGLGGDSAVAMIFGPYSTTQALYYTTYTGGGQVRRVTFTGSVNRAPTAVAFASPTFGPVPLLVTLDATGSSDPDGDPLTFDWSLGDGSVLTGMTSLTVTHTYTPAGIYTATLTARDNRGGVSAPATVRIDAGNTPPVPVILSPTLDTLFHVGQVITLTGVATDTQDGVLPDLALSWRVVLHHIDQTHPENAHTHPYLPPTPGNHIAFVAPPPEDLDATALSHLEIQLTATDAWGASTTLTQTLEPQRVNVTFASQPDGLRLTVNSVPLTATQSITSWVSYALNVVALNPQPVGTVSWWVFDHWSDGGAAAHTITTPLSDITYTMTFTSFTPIHLWLPVARRE